MQNDGGPGDNRNHQPYGGGGDAGTDSKVFVATTLAALVLAGSAYIWKSGTIPMLRSSVLTGGGEIFRKDNIGDHNQSMPADAGPSSLASSQRDKAGDSSRAAIPVGQASPKKRRASQVKQQQQHEREGPGHDAAESGGDVTATGTSLGRASRPKERRRRGKDPTKELVKSGKLNTTKIFNTAKPKAGRSPSPVSSSSRGQQASTTPRRSQRQTSASRSHSRGRTLDGSSAAASLHQQRSSRSRSRSRTRSQRGGSSVHEEEEDEHQDPVFTFDSLATSANHDTASTSSASSTAATDATACSAISTAPSSTTSRDHHPDRPRSESSDGTPRADSSTTSQRTSSSRHAGRGSAAKDPSWDWDDNTQFNPHSPDASTDVPTRFQPLSKGAVSGTSGHHEKSPLSSSSSEVQSSNVVPFASIVSAGGESSVPALASASSASAPAGEVSNTATSPRTEEEEEDEVEVSFPTLNNPGSSSASALGPVTTTNSASPSISRPHSRASTSSTTSSSKGKAKNSRAISGLTSLSTRSGSGGTPSMPSTSSRRVPTPLDAGPGRPSTPSSASLSSSTHPPPSPSSPYHHYHHSPSASTSGLNSNGNGGVAVSAQTQLASLRGALEAARLREEKSKSELDKVMKDVDALRWENAVSRRREVELQAQLQQVMLQMQGYATYIAAMNQQTAAAQGQGQPSDFQLQVPPPSHQPGISPPAPAEIVAVAEGEEVGAQVPIEEKVESSSRTDEQPSEDRLPAAQDSDGRPNEDPLLNSGEGNPDEQSNATPAEQPSSTPSGDAMTDDTTSPSLPPIPPLRPPTTAPQTILPFAPQPLHGTFPGTGIPMALHSPFLLSHHLQHHPGTPNPQSPLMSNGPHSPFPFPPPPHHHPFGSQPQHPQQAHPHYPFMALGLSGGPGIAGHMPLQSPILHPHPPHPGMMMMPSPHPGGGFNGLPPASPFASIPPGSPSTSSFRPMTPATHGAIPSNMGIGMGSGGGGLQSHAASPLWMNGFVSASNANGGPSASASSKLSMSPASGPSSPLPPYLQSERGRKGWQSHQQRSRPSSMVGGIKAEGDVDELESIPQEARGDTDDGVNDDDEDGGGLNPLLADAILKRPSSIRMNSKRSTSNFARDSVAAGLAGSVSMPGMPNGRAAASPSLPHGFGGEASHQEQSSPLHRHAQDEVEEEVMFPSLSELGNVAREKRVGTPAQATGDKTSRLALSMSSPASAKMISEDSSGLEVPSIP